MANLSHEDEVALHIFREISADWSFSSAIFADTFSEAGLDDGGKEIVVATVRDMLAQYRRLEFALDSSGAEIAAAKRPLALMLASRLLGGRISPDRAKQFLRGPEWEDVARVDERIAAIADPLQRFALAHSLPDTFAASIIEEYGREAGALADALNKFPPTVLRANALKATRDEVRARLQSEGFVTHPCELSKYALRLDNPARLFTSEAFQNGLFEMQDEGSQLIAELVEPARGSRVLDACAGSGGKTLGLSALMGGSGALFALDTSDRKIEELRRRARRAGAHNIRVMRTAHDDFPAEIQALKGKFNRVLVDAPCGGSGALRRNPEARWRAERGQLEGLQPLQETLLRRALEYCADGGRAIYATCSLLRAENETLVEKILAEGGCEIVPLKLIFGKERASRMASDCGRFLKLLPHRHDTDGFFAAVLKKIPRG